MLVLFFFFSLPSLKGRQRMAIYKLVFLKPNLCMQLWREQCAIKNGWARSGWGVRYRKGGGKSDSLLFKKFLSLYANTESLQWRALVLLKTGFVKIKIYNFVYWSNSYSLFEYFIIYTLTFDWILREVLRV